MSADVDTMAGYAERVGELEAEVRRLRRKLGVRRKALRDLNRAHERTMRWSRDAWMRPRIPQGGKAEEERY